MKESGKMIYNMDKEKKFGQMVQSMMGCTGKEESMEKELTFGQILHLTKEIGKTIK